MRDIRVGKYLAPFRIRSNFKNDDSRGFVHVRMYLYVFVCEEEAGGYTASELQLSDPKRTTQRVRVQRYAVWSFKI